MDKNEEVATEPNQAQGEPDIIRTRKDAVSRISVSFFGCVFVTVLILVVVVPRQIDRLGSEAVEDSVALKMLGAVGRILNGGNRFLSVKTVIFVDTPVVIAATLLLYWALSVYLGDKPSEYINTFKKVSQFVIVATFGIIIFFVFFTLIRMMMVTF